MNIDFTKLITLLLPTFMRTGLTALISTIASQFTSLYADFQLWQMDIRLQAAMTCQVMYLETILNYKLLGSFIRTIYITDGDGVIVDFVVNVPNGLDIDNYRMIALIEKYKMCGKRYTIGQSAYTYTVNWSTFYCELADLEFVVQWTNPVCELELVVPQYYTYMGNSEPTSISSVNACSIISMSRGYYTNPGGLSLNNRLYNDSALTILCSGYGNMFIALSKDGTGARQWVQIDNEGTIIAFGNC